MSKEITKTERETVNEDGTVTVETVTVTTIREGWTQWFEWDGGPMPDKARCWIPHGVEVRYRGIIGAYAGPYLPAAWEHGEKRISGDPRRDFRVSPHPDYDIIAYRLRIN
jgi:hypothetical protein